MKFERPTWKAMGEKWPSKFVARSEMAHFTGGLVTPSTMARLDAQGKGPKYAYRIGGKLGYGVDELVMWLEARTIVQ
jgi:hypothetical protein